MISTLTDLLAPSPAAQLTVWLNQGRKSSPQRAVTPSRATRARAGLLRSPLRTRGSRQTTALVHRHAGARQRDGGRRQLVLDGHQGLVLIPQGRAARVKQLQG